MFHRNMDVLKGNLHSLGILQDMDFGDEILFVQINDPLEILAIVNFFGILQNYFQIYTY